MWYKDYDEYLRSPEFAEKKRLVALRSGGACERGCGEIAEETHHIRYPKKWGTEPIEWLLHCCKNCHEFLHGLTDLDPKSFGTDWISLYQERLRRLKI